jgi:hypothetical protein
MKAQRAPTSSKFPARAGELSAASSRMAAAAMAQHEVGGPALALAATRQRANPLRPQTQDKARAKRIPNSEFARILAALPRRGEAQSTRYALPFADIANSLGLSYSTTLAVFSNGRAFSQIGEEHAAILMGFELHHHKDVRGTDGFRTDPKTGAKLLVSVKSAARANVKFQLSVYTGAGRKCSPANLLDSINQADTIVVVDVRQLPHVRITEFPAQCAVDWIEAGILSASGMTAERFYLACGASCSQVIQGAHDFSKELEALVRANAEAEEKHLQGRDSSWADDPFVPSAAFQALAAKVPKALSKKAKAAPISIRGVVGKPLSIAKRPRRTH